MKLRQIINENQIINEIRKSFSQDGRGIIPIEEIIETPDGYNLKGPVRINEKNSFKKLPWKINIVRGDFDMQGRKLESLENFPREARIIIVDDSENMTSLESSDIIDANTLEANNIPIRNLKGAKLHVVVANFTNCHNLQSLEGNERNLYTVDISNCSHFSQDPMTITKCSIIKANSNCVKLPLVKAILFSNTNYNGPKFIFDFDYNFHRAALLREIYNKYLGKGPSQIINLIRELNDAGFKDHARI